MNRAARVGLIAVAVVVVASLGRYYVSRAHTTTTTTSTVVSTTTTTTTLPTGTTTTSTTTAASLTTCRGGEFTGVNLGSQGAAGTGYDTMTLTKVTPGSCVVDGYPLVTLQDSHGVVVSSGHMVNSTNFPSPANHGPSAYSLSLGQKVAVQLRYSDVPVGTETCPSIAQANISFVAGDTSVPVSFAFPISPCVQQSVGVSAFYPS